MIGPADEAVRLCGNPRKHRGERTLQVIRVAALPLRGGAGRVEDGD